MSTKLQTVVKYLAMLFFTVHWSACLLRLLTLIACQANQGPHSNQKKYKKELDRDGCQPLSARERKKKNPISFLRTRGTAFFFFFWNVLLVCASLGGPGGGTQRALVSSQRSPTAGPL